MNNRKEHPGDLVLFLGSDVIGRGSDHQLGSLLMAKFLHTLCGPVTKPDTIALMNDGVRLVVEDSPVLGELRLLEEQGVGILACGTCLSRFSLTSKVAVGKVSNMQDITDTLLKAAKVLSL